MQSKFSSISRSVGAQEAWKSYDLVRGYCTYDFFGQCPHRMACAKCSFYIPKVSTAPALLEGKSNLLRMRQEIPLIDAELAALDDGVSALESLLTVLPVCLRPRVQRLFNCKTGRPTVGKAATEASTQKKRKRALRHRRKALEAKR